jgi:hypothetical protein
VYLKKTNGTLIRVPMGQLSAASQQLAQQMAQAAATAAMGSAQPDSAEAAVRTILQQLQQGNVRSVWDALPASYQSDVNDLVHTFAENMDGQIWSGGVTIANKAVKLLKDKKEFILNHPQLAENPMDDATVDRNWTAVVEILETLLASELADLEKMKSLDVGQFLSGTGNTMMQQMAAIAESVESSGVGLEGIPGAAQVESLPLANLSKVQISVVRADADTAVLKMVGPEGEAEETEFVRYEGKWLPKEMVDGWAQGIADAKAQLLVVGQQMKDNRQQALMPMMMVGGVLDQLLAAETQEQFNEVVQGIVGMFMPDMDGVEVEGVEAGDGGFGADPFGAGGAGN